MILIAYDGSPDANAAIERAATLFPGQPATVVTVWQRFVDTMTRAGLGLSTSSGVHFDEVDAASEQAAAQRAAEGADVAKQAGLEATAHTAVVRSTVAAAILHEAGEVEADSIVLGSRGLTGVKSFLLGSVSTAVLHHADRPVVVVPSPEVAVQRTAHLEDDL